MHTVHCSFVSVVTFNYNLVTTLPSKYNLPKIKFVCSVKNLLCPDNYAFIQFV